MSFIWELDNWTDFRWDNDVILPMLLEVRKKQGYILGKGESLELKDISTFIISEAVKTSEIEGEKIDVNSVRSSVANRLGLDRAGLVKDSSKTDGLIDILLDATRNYTEPLTDTRFFSWHAALFPTGFSGIHKITVADWRVGDEPMEVVSGTIGETNIHYVAPPSKQVPVEMNKFIYWFNSSEKLDGILKSAIAHLWFVTIHPFDDGNGRLARVLTDLALAKDEKTGLRLYSLSSQIIQDKSEYYNVLETTQRGCSDITIWLKWFLNMYNRSIDASIISVEKAIKLNALSSDFTELNKRQIKILKIMIEALPDSIQGDLTPRKYSKITKTSVETAKRDIKGLIDKGILIKGDAGGRSTSYYLSNRVKF